MHYSRAHFEHIHALFTHSSYNAQFLGGPGEGAGPHHELEAQV